MRVKETSPGRPQYICLVEKKLIDLILFLEGGVCGGGGVFLYLPLYDSNFRYFEMKFLDLTRVDCKLL